MQLKSINYRKSLWLSLQNTETKILKNKYLMRLKLASTFASKKSSLTYHLLYYLTHKSMVSIRCPSNTYKATQYSCV